MPCFADALATALAVTQERIQAEFDCALAAREQEHKRELVLVRAVVDQLCDSTDPQSRENVQFPDFLERVPPSPALQCQKQDFGTQTPVDWPWSISTMPLLPQSEVESDVAQIPRLPARGATYGQQIGEEGCASSNFLKGSKLEDILWRAEKADAGMMSTITEEKRLLKKICGKRSRRNRELVLDQGMSIVIVANTILMGVSADVAVQWSGWLVVDAIFAGVFFLELMMKMKILGVWQYLFGKLWRWNWFELILVSLAILECVIAQLDVDAQFTQNASLFRIIRLVRVTRLIRMCRVTFFVELLMMINGAIGGLRALFWAFLLVSFPLYAVAIVLRESVGMKDETGFGAELFANLPLSFFTLFRCIIGGDCSDTSGRPLFPLIMDEYGWLYGIIYCVTTYFMTFGLFNVINAIYVESTLASARYTDICNKQKRLMDHTFLADKLKNLVLVVEAILQDENGEEGAGSETITRRASHAPSTEDILRIAKRIRITQESFERIIECPEVSTILTELDIANEEQVDLFDTLDVDGSGSVDLGEMVTGITKLRGDARRSDIVAVSLVVRNLQASFQNLAISVQQTMNSRSAAINAFPRQCGNFRSDSQSSL